MPRQADSGARQSARALRVLVLNERCHANELAGGAEVHLFEVCSRLAARGMPVELLCSAYGTLPATDEHRGVRVSRVGGRLGYYARVPGEVRRRVAAGEVDLVVEFLNKVPFLTPLYAGVPTLAFHHHLHGWTAFRQVNPLLAAASVALESSLRWAYRRSPFLTISSSSRADLVGRGVAEAAIDIVPCGIDHDLYRPAPLSGRPPTLVSLGRLEPYKRLDLLLDAMAILVRRMPEARLVIVGRGQEEDVLRARAQRLGLGDSVRFTGYVSEAEKVRILQQAAALVQCSEKEGWGLSVFEGYACGTPVVARAVPGLQDSVQDGLTGVLVHRPRPAVLATTIHRLLLDEERRVAMAGRAVTWAKQFQWDEAADATERAVHELACGPACAHARRAEARSKSRIVAACGAEVAPHELSLRVRGVV